MSISKKSDDKLENIRHSLAHLLAASVLKKYPKTKLGIGPAIENGFYYDFLFAKPITQSDLTELEKEMKKMIADKLLFYGEKVTSANAKNIFNGQPFKLELVKDFSKEKKQLTIYKTGFVFVDLCRGGHVKNTKEINSDAFKLTHIAGAYWKGSEKNKMLTRIYGVAFGSKKEMDAYLKMEAEAKRRDHKKLGPELDLFTFSDLVGGGLPLWTPKGTTLRNLLDNFVWELRKKHGYQQVDIPHLAKKALYERSGHWDKFGDDLFRVISREKHVYALKPMNCPHHTQIYARKPHSYRDVPQRYANTTKVYRDEQTGELSGITRVISITQDDAHVFCRYSQVEDEMLKIFDIMDEFYKALGLSLRVRLSLRDPKQPEKYLGTPKVWKEAEDRLRSIIRKKKLQAEEMIGEAAFYGPKIDFLAKDSLGREWQVTTLQLDFNLPERFDLSCINERGKKERIVMLHAAITGSLERCIAVLIEHFAGAFPVWLAPVQVAILPISEKQSAYADEIFQKLEAEGIRSEFPLENETLGKRIRETEMQKIPYTLVIGEKEQSNKTVSVRHLKRGQEGEVKFEDFIKKIKSEIEKKVV